MANYELVALVEGTPQLRAPTAADVATTVGKLYPDLGIQLGGATSDNLLNVFEKDKTFTPVLTFGGASTGITYGSQLGWYTKIGNRIIGEGWLSLTSKGSAVGSAQVTIPVACLNDSTYRAAVTVIYEDVAVTDYPRANIVGAASTVVNLQECTNAGAVTALTNADFVNNSNLIYSFSYII
jgi:hypothetical protein